jgi:hypothetical protein
LTSERLYSAGKPSGVDYKCPKIALREAGRPRKPQRKKMVTV